MQFLINGENKIEQAARFFTSTLRNYQLHMLNFTQSKKFNVQHDLETKTKTFQGTEFYKGEKIIKVRRLQMTYFYTTFM